MTSTLFLCSREFGMPVPGGPCNPPSSRFPAWFLQAGTELIINCTSAHCALQ